MCKEQGSDFRSLIREILIRMVKEHNNTAAERKGGEGGPGGKDRSLA